jgi:hypothetical protein
MIDRFLVYTIGFALFAFMAAAFLYGAGIIRP